MNKVIFNMSQSAEALHREKKRRGEMEIALACLEPYVGSPEGKRILEFGSGDGYQIQYLRKLGKVVASDICRSEDTRDNFSGADFVICDIKETPFKSANFDMIFSNHVLEHIKDIKKAFLELKRIGKDDCLYAFTVPTNIWLWLSLPAQFYNGIRKLIGRKSKQRKSSRVERGGSGIKGLRRFLPRGHGWRKDFFECLDSFKIERWKSLFSENGFRIIRVEPLLLYAPSEFPIIPTTRFLTKRGICSSAFFIMKKETPDSSDRVLLEEKAAAAFKK